MIEIYRTRILAPSSRSGGSTGKALSVAIMPLLA